MAQLSPWVPHPTTIHYLVFMFNWQVVGYDLQERFQNYATALWLNFSTSIILATVSSLLVPPSCLWITAVAFFCILAWWIGLEEAKDVVEMGVSGWGACPAILAWWCCQTVDHSLCLLLPPASTPLLFFFLSFILMFVCQECWGKLLGVKFWILPGNWSHAELCD